MKILSAIAKVVAAVAFIAGVVYLIATYGDKLVAWAKKLLPCKESEGEVVEETEEVEAPAEEVAEEETPAEETPVAEDADFEG